MGLISWLQLKIVHDQNVVLSSYHYVDMLSRRSQWQPERPSHRQRLSDELKKEGTSMMARSQSILQILCLFLLLATTFLGSWLIFSRLSTQAQEPIKMIGTWNATTTFLSGPKQGEEESLLLHFDEDGRLEVHIQTPDGTILATGSWWSNEQRQVIYTFVEPVQPGLLVAVTHAISSNGDQTFSSEGRGHIYPLGDQELALQGIVETETQATREQKR